MKSALIYCLFWFQFEEDILDISLAVLDRSLKHREDPAVDVSQRNSPVYVSRVVSATVKSSSTYSYQQNPNPHSPSSMDSSMFYRCSQAKNNYKIGKMEIYSSAQKFAHDWRNVSKNFWGTLNLACIFWHIFSPLDLFTNLESLCLFWNHLLSFSNTKRSTKYFGKPVLVQLHLISEFSILYLRDINSVRLSPFPATNSYNSSSQTHKCTTRQLKSFLFYK